MNLLPFPRQIAFERSAPFRLNASFTLDIRGECEERLYKAAERMLRRLAGRTGLFFPQGPLNREGAPESPSMVVVCKRKGKVALGEDESYRLVVSEQRIDLFCATDIGGIRGLETLLQLLQADERGYFFPSVTLDDSPCFAWRGLLLDVCRHFMPMEVVKRNLDAMAAVKLNVFHWHLTEDQGFRVESKTFPQLHRMGSDGLYYTQEQVREVIAYAADRGIRVVPEFGMPGHSTSWFVGMPELASAPGPYQIARTYGVKDPAMDPTREETYRVLAAFLEEMAALFPDEYVHIGGDENNGKSWAANPEIQRFMKDKGIPDARSLQAHFNNRILRMLTSYGKKMIGWDEILHPDMPTSIVIQSWRGTKSLVESACRGYMGILSNGYYIDLVQSAAFHYLNDPIPEGSGLSERERQKILGGEATMWAELVTPENVDSRIWPRTAAIAERLWSPREIRDERDMYRRLELVSGQLEELGIMHIKNYEMMLRRLAGHRNVTPLKTLVDILEPLKIYNRHRQGIVYTSYAPLTRVVDAALPDSSTARNFNAIVDEFLGSSTAEKAKEIQRWLGRWKSNHEELARLIEKSPILQEIGATSEILSLLSEKGLLALDAILSGNSPEESWVKDAFSVAQKARKPCAETELMVVSGIEKLIQASRKNR